MPDLSTSLFTFILGGFSFAMGLRLALQNRKWHKVWAKSVVTFYRKENGAYQGPGADPGDRAPLIGYTFLIEGKTISSDRIYVSAQASSGGIGANHRVERALLRFTDGMEVRYNPANPKECALLPNPLWAVLVSTVMGGGFCLFGLVGILMNAL